MNNKLTKIDKQLERLEAQKKELIEKKKKEEREKLIEIGKIVAKYIDIGSIKEELLKESIELYYIPRVNGENENVVNKEKEGQKL